MTEIDELYVVARRVLLDALEAIGEHRDSTILVGSQAIYLRVGEADIAVAPYTTDGDLAIDPTALAATPRLEEAMRGAGFQPMSEKSVGIWVTSRVTAQNPDTKVEIDLLVPTAVSPDKKGRSPRLPNHDLRAARRVDGLDGALVDFDLMSLGALDPADTRKLHVRVAGPAALLIAKAHKINDRVGTGRESDKDALDVFRILRGIETKDLVRRYKQILADPRSQPVAVHGRALLAEQFGKASGPGIAMAVRSTRSLMDPNEVAASCEALAQAMLEGL